MIQKVPNFPDTKTSCLASGKGLVNGIYGGTADI